MAADSVLIPPIATNLNDPQGTNQTAQEWYLYWQRSGQRINTLNGMVTYGTAAGRLDPSLAPDGALYVESDRDGIIYENQGGVWHYLAGTMWAMLNPDQRPVGLGANDAGFTFRTIDTAPAYSGRTFVWSGSLWVETTATRFDTHANRLAVSVSNLENGMLWVETDRSEVIYQLQGTAWHFCAGTMWGTISPDQRPTDLGANDAGFHFRGTDQAREFIWSGTIWVEVGLSNYDVNGTLIGTRATLNLIAGSNTTISGVDNAASNRVDVTISSTGGGTGGAVSSVFGRTGAVVAATGDYSASMVTNAVDSTGAYANPSWVTSLAWSKITGTPAATATVLGCVKIGTNVSVAADGTISVPPVAAFQTPWLSDINAAGFRLTTLSASNNPLIFAPNATEAVRITPAGSVGIGIVAPSTTLSLGTVVAPIKLAIYDGGVSNCYGIGIGSGYLAFGSGISPTSGTPNMVLDSSGRLGIGTTSPTHQLELSTDSAYKTTTNTWLIPSDIRLKQNIQPLEGGLEVINRLEPIVAEYNGKAGTPAGGRVVSLDPAKLRGILPHAVSSVPGKLDSEETEILGVNTHEILYHLVLAVQQLAKK